ncbi:hypothetical protein CUPA0038 [Campylobacter upsaliensis RM3195]|uniref:hypothetical protein n=1 Tax=Campylobacter upsaliensis TaxID=28080 RepID=UPI00004B3E39|nr:hypothetical protein [Campylobacter upsaliensis]EAL52494.1 hypothetical protein CUPA0038 [Campylobacter upsaliensis RM3195]
METKRLQEKYKEFYEYHLQMYKDKYEKITSEELEELFEYYMLYRIANDDNTDLERKMRLVILFRCGWKNLRIINKILAKYTYFDEGDFVSFMRLLKEINSYEIIESLYDDKELKEISKAYKRITKKEQKCQVKKI